MSCSQVHLNLEYECSNQSTRFIRKSDKDDIHTTLLDMQMTLHIRIERILHLNHFLERINIYNEEEFDYEIDRIRI